MAERRERLIALARSWKGETPPAVVAKKPIGIEALLRWAYLEELPKAEAKPRAGPDGFVASGRSGIFSDGAVSTDSSWLNRYGVVADLLATDDPHPDALKIAEAVAGLDAFDLVLPDDWNPFGELGEMNGHLARSIGAVLERLTATDMDGKRKLRERPSGLILRCAVLGSPDWAIDVPELKFICSANGKPKWFVRRLVTDPETGASYEVEVDGMSATKKRALPDAYHKSYLDPDPLEAGIARGEFEIWRNVLDWLAGELHDKLDSHEPLLATDSLRPWEDANGGKYEGRILQDLSKPCLRLDMPKRARANKQV